MKRIISITLFIILCTPVVLFSAGVTLLLNPNYSSMGSDIRINDVARLNGDTAASERIGALIVPDEMYKDGFIDRQEIMTLLNGNGFSDCLIYGNAIRIVEPQMYSEAQVPRMPVISRGAAVTLIMKNKGITLTVKGIAQESGSPGDSIKVKVRKGQMVSGKVIDNETVESVL